jgi:hypothetical protein
VLTVLHALWCAQGLDKFAEWAVAAEADLRAIAGNLEYVSAVLEKESEGPSAQH